MIGNTVSMTSGGHLHYDTNLANESPHIYYVGGSSNQASPFPIAEFSWNMF